MNYLKAKYLIETSEQIFKNVYKRKIGDILRIDNLIREGETNATKFFYAMQSKVGEKTDVFLIVIKKYSL